MTYSNEDLELFWLRYQAEGLPQNMSLQEFCSKNKVPFNLVNKWYRDTRHKIAEVRVAGAPQNQEDEPNIYKSDTGFRKDGSKPLRILLDLRMSNGMQIRRGGMSFEELKKLVSNLEVLC